MNIAKVSAPSRRWIAIGALLLSSALSACSAPQGDINRAAEVYDPYENVNRGVHQFNLGVDKVLFRPTAVGYSSIVPDPIEDSIGYFAENISAPRTFVNAILQADMKTAGRSLARFVINSTVGFGGLADPATEFGIEPVEADFGQTLHVWGFAEGAYMELPVFGPSTGRDTVGIVVDFFTNPLGYVLPSPEDRIGIYAQVLDKLGDRGRFSDTVDSILYDSADSYAQSRLIYLQNRRFELAGEGQETYLDPYADPYSDLTEDPYAE